MKFTSHSFNFIVKKIAILVACSLLATSTAYGSGDGGGGGNGGSGGSGGKSLNVSEATYELGKKVFLEKVVCDSCIYADLELTSQSVSTSWKAIKKDLRRSGEIGSDLERKERRSVKLFMRKRFDL